MTAAHVVIGAGVAAMAAGAAVAMRLAGALRVVADAVAADPSMWPTSVAGWAALFLAIMACVALFVGWGKMLARFDGIGSQLNDVTSRISAVKLTVDRIEDELTVVQHTLWGPRGDDGIALEVRDIRGRVSDIERGNTIRDAFDERERGASEHGGERRASHRRREDRIALGEEEGPR